MFRSISRVSAFAVLFVLLCNFVGAQDKDSDSSESQSKSKTIAKLNSGTVSALKLRSIGPAFMSGRIADVAIDPVKPNTWYIAAGSGNLWKTENAGTTFKPIFDNYGSYSIGCVTIDPHNRKTIWVGTGENVAGRHVGFGDGVYRSNDGGKSFKNVGLNKSEHISKILVDPRDPDIVYVASQGPLWSPGGERGLYKSTDGGVSWNSILSKGPYTGVTDLVMDPRDPDVLYAATHQRHRTVWSLVDGGPESGVHKSIDGGKTWNKLGSGLPGGDLGKIALAISPQKPSVVYASIELPGKKGGFWRSDDAGESWSKRSDYISGGTGPHYYQEIYADPHRFDVVYQANVNLGRTEDGGKSWKSVSSSTKHVDNHAVGFHPTDPDFLLVGCDGGVYFSYDYAKTYRYAANLPLTQFYKVDVDYDKPFYHVVGGTQDNNTQHGPSRTGSNAGIRNSDWMITIGGDGHDCAIDPTNPNIIYCESQQGNLRRYDRSTGQSINIQPQPGAGEPSLRFNWDSPIHISPHNPARIYHGSKKLHRSDNRGDSWTSISGDLSRNKNRLTKKVMERVWSVDAIYDLYAMSQYGNITSISESPKVEGLIYVGTDDGLIQTTEDGGKNWRAVDRVFDVPEMAFVNDVKADLHDADTVYVALDHHKTGDFSPYLIKSEDRGKTWKSITGDLPERHLVWRVIQDHVNPKLLFAGTEFGVFFTINGGENWIKLSGAPTIPFRDLEIQRREDDLVGATFGRSFYVLDDYTPLRTMSDELLKKELAWFPIRDALLYIPRRPLGGRKGYQGDSFYSADNPDFGATFTFYLKDVPKTEAEQRAKREADISKAGGDVPTPDFDELENEKREEGPVLHYVIKDAKGNLVRRIVSSARAGLQRFRWDLRHASLAGQGSGPLAAPGKYSVQLTLSFGDEQKTLGEPQSFQVVSISNPTLPEVARKKTQEFQAEAGDLQRSAIAASRKLGEMQERVQAIKRVVKTSIRAPEGAHKSANEIENALRDIEIELHGDSTRRAVSHPSEPSIMSRIQTALGGTLSQTHGPTETYRQQLEIARTEFQDVRKKLNQLLDKSLVPLEAKLDEAGVPWTTGRRIPPSTAP